MHLLEALVEVREAAREQDRRHRERRVARVVEDLGQRRGGGSEGDRRSRGRRGTAGRATSSATASRPWSRWPGRCSPRARRPLAPLRAERALALAAGRPARGCGAHPPRDGPDEAPSDAHTLTSSDGGLYGRCSRSVTLPPLRHLKDVTFHSGEREMQRRAGVADEARAVGRGIGRTADAPRGAVPGAPAPGRGGEPRRRTAASGPRCSPGRPGFLSAADPQPPAHRGAADSRRSARLEPRGRGRSWACSCSIRRRASACASTGAAASPTDGLSLDLQQVYGNCPKYIQLREAEADGVARPERPR